MDIPLYALEGLGSGMLETSIEAMLVNNVSQRVDDSSIAMGNVSSESSLSRTMRMKVRREQIRKMKVARSDLKRMSRALLEARKAQARARASEVTAQKRGDRRGIERARVEERVQDIKERAIEAGMRVSSRQATNPVFTKQELMKLAMPEIKKASRVIASAIKAKMRSMPSKVRRGLPQTTKVPFYVKLPKSIDPLDKVLYPDNGLDNALGQFKRVNPYEMDIQGLGAIFATTPPFNQNDFDYPRTENEWSEQFESEEVSDTFGPMGALGDDDSGDASEVNQSDDWSPVTNVFPGSRERRWDFDQNVIAEHAPTKENVNRLIRGGVKAAMRTLDQTDSVDQMNDNLRQFGITPKPSGQPFTTAGNVAYKQIIAGLSRGKMVSTSGGLAVDSKIKPKKFRKVLGAGLREERKLRALRQRNLRWLGR